MGRIQELKGCGGGEAGGEADTLVSVSGRWGSPWARELWDP